MWLSQQKKRVPMTSDQYFLRLSWCFTHSVVSSGTVYMCHEVSWRDWSHDVTRHRHDIVVMWLRDAQSADKSAHYVAMSSRAPGARANRNGQQSSSSVGRFPRDHASCLRDAETWTAAAAAATAAACWSVHRSLPTVTHRTPLSLGSISDHDVDDAHERNDFPFSSRDQPVRRLFIVCNSFPR